MRMKASETRTALEATRRRSVEECYVPVAGFELRLNCGLLDFGSASLLRSLCKPQALSIKLVMQGLGLARCDLARCDLNQAALSRKQPR